VTAIGPRNNSSDTHRTRFHLR